MPELWGGNGRVLNMSKELMYQAFKRYLGTLNLSSAEYEKRLKEWCERNKY